MSPQTLSGFSCGYFTREFLLRHLHYRWKSEREKSIGFASIEHPFHYRGEGKAYTYKLFLELGYSLLKSGGRLGVIVPSGLYSDHGASELRQLFLDRCNWEWLFGFENRDGIFGIHRSFKFNSIILGKDGRTIAVRTAFMRHRLEDWESAEALSILYPRAQVLRLSPRSKSILEIQSHRDLEILDTILNNSLFLSDRSKEAWGIEYAQGDFNLTSDSKLFFSRYKWEELGFLPDEYGRWVKGNWQSRTHMCPAPTNANRIEITEGIVLTRDGHNWISEEQIEKIALPLYQATMIHSFDPSAKAWIRGTALQATWENVPFDDKRWNPQYLIDSKVWEASSHFNQSLRIGYREVARNTDTRSFICAAIPPFPAGHKLPILCPTLSGLSDIDSLSGVAYFNSFLFDWALRARLGGLAIGWFVLDECRIPGRNVDKSLALCSARLNLIHKNSAPHWIRLMIGIKTDLAWPRLFSLTHSERLRMRVVIDAIVASRFGAKATDLKYILRDSDHPVNQWRPLNKAGKLDPKGFWRVNKDKDPELRHTVLTLIAFHDLGEKISACGGDREKGIEAFLNQNDGEGWMIPETLRLADYGLGHDNRAKEHQPVASRLGPRFYDWQLAQSPEESWRECHLHARNLLGEEGYKQLLAQIEAEKRGETITPHTESSPTSAEKAQQKNQQTLFD